MHWMINRRKHSLSYSCALSSAEVFLPWLIFIPRIVAHVHSVIQVTIIMMRAPPIGLSSCTELFCHFLWHLSTWTFQGSLVYPRHLLYQMNGLLLNFHHKHRNSHLPNCPLWWWDPQSHHLWGHVCTLLYLQIYLYNSYNNDFSIFLTLWSLLFPICTSLSLN